MPVAWNEDRIEWLKTMWAKGMTATQIAAEMGDVTRNAVLGKAHRLELQDRVRTPRISRPKRRDGGHMRAQAITRMFEKGSGAQIVTLPADHADLPVTLMDLEPHHCRWPCSGDGAETLFCGGDAVQEMPYCLRHCLVAYSRPIKDKAA